MRSNGPSGPQVYRPEIERATEPGTSESPEQGLRSLRILALQRTFLPLRSLFSICAVLVAAGVAGGGPPPADAVISLGFDDGPADARMLGAGDWTSGGKFGGAISLDGTGPAMVLDDAPPLDARAGVTLEAWVYPVGPLSEERAVLTLGSDGYELTTGAVDDVPAERWIHLAVTYEESVVRSYVNGTPVEPRSRALPTLDVRGPLRIGGGRSDRRAFNGRIDEVRVYARALTAAEIARDMLTPVGGQPVGGPKLVILSPSDQETIPGTALEVTYAILGDETAVRHARFQLDDGWEVTDPTLDGTYRFESVTVRPHTLSGYLVRADNTRIPGSEAVRRRLTTIVDPSDAIPPIVSIVGPAEGELVSGVATIVADAHDDAGLLGVQFRVDGEPVGAVDTAPPYETSWNSAAGSNGTHVLSASALDLAGNESIVASVSVDVANAALADPSTVGQWAGPFSWPLVSVHTTLLPNGKVLLYDDHTNNAGVQVWDPSSGSLTSRPYNAKNLFCSAHIVLPTGKVLVAGGHLGAYWGIEDATFFDPVNQAWSAAAPMSQARWYPTETVLPDGRILVVSGASNCPTCDEPNGSHDGIALIPEVYNTPNNTWSQLPSASLSLPLYPHMFVLPDGRVLASSSQEDPIVTRVLNVAAQTWSVVDPVVRNGGSSVMFRPGKILKTGTARNPDYPPAAAAATAYVLDMTQPSPSWQAVAPMSFARTQHNLTLLPDGNVLVVGGGTNSDVFDTAAAVKDAELWSPTSQTFTLLSRMSEPRLYHSTSLLLPDGRVLVSGGGRYGPDFPSAELFSPPYLFKGPRPSITAAPAVLQYGGHFSVGTPDAASVSKVTLLGTGAVTHAFDAGQRYLELAFTPISGGLDVTAPASGNLAPPGYYLLFLLDGNGVPSAGSIVKLPAPWEDATPPTAPTNLSALTSIGRVDLTWTAATDNTSVALYNVHRFTTPGTAPTSANRVGQSSTTAYQDTGLASGTYFYVVTAQDGNGNVGPKSNEVNAAVIADTTPPSVGLTSPAANATVFGLVTVTADASDDVGVAGVQFLIDGVPLGLEDTAAPWAIDWNSGLSNNGAHTLAARARDARGNQTTSAGVTVTASNGQIQGLVAAYAFDEASGALTHDSSGNANHGSVTNALWSASGHSGSALLFDGSSDYVQVPNSASLNVAGTGLTVELWANITSSSGGDYVLLGKPWTVGTTGSPPYQFGLEFGASASTLDFYFGDTGGASHGRYSLTAPIGTWVHVAYTYDGTAVNGYLDGVLRISTPTTGSIQGRPTPLLIGVDGSLGQGFKGRLDDVRIYNRALTVTEIVQDKNSPVPRAVSPVPDGTFGTPMRASRGVATTEIDLTWDATSCPAPGYHIVYGSLSTLPSYQVVGGVCGIGASGSYGWTTAPSGDLWFVVVADDGATEGLWGEASTGPMKSTTPSYVCGITGRVNLQTCP